MENQPIEVLPRVASPANTLCSPGSSSWGFCCREQRRQNRQEPLPGRSCIITLLLDSQGVSHFAFHGHASPQPRLYHLTFCLVTPLRPPLPTCFGTALARTRFGTGYP